MLHESPHGRNQSIEGLPLEVLGLVASKLRSDTNKRPGTELIACVSRKWSCVTQHVSNIALVLDGLSDPDKAASLAAWMQHHGHCLGSLSLDVTTQPYPQHLDLLLQQVLPALQQTALAAANPPPPAPAPAPAAAPPSAAAAVEGGGGGGAGASLGLTQLVLKGATASYPQLGTLLGALRNLRELQLCTSSSRFNGVGGAQHFPNTTAMASLGQQLSGVATSLTRLQRLRLDWYLKGQDLSRVLPPSLTGLTAVLTNRSAGAGSQRLTHLVKLRQLTICAGINSYGMRRPAVLSDAGAVAALPALEEVAVEERVLGQEAFRQLSRHLVRLSYTSYYVQVPIQDATALTSLTSLTATSSTSSTFPKNWVPVLPALTALRCLRLHVCEARTVPEHVAACGQLRLLKDLEVKAAYGYTSTLQVNMSLPTQLTGLTMLAGFQPYPWHQCLAPLKQLQVLVAQQCMLLGDEDVLTALTALTKLVIATRSAYNGEGGLQVVALQQVQAVGGRLRALVVVGQPPSRRLEQQLAAVLPASCKWELCEHLAGVP